MNVQAVKFVDHAVGAPKIKQPALVLSSISSDAQIRCDALGVDVAGKSLALDHDCVLHVVKSHGGAQEVKRGQVPVTSNDIARWAEIFNNAALAVGEPPVAKDKTKMLSGVSELDEWVYGFAAKVRRADVVPQTLFKRARK